MQIPPARHGTKISGGQTSLRKDNFYSTNFPIRIVTDSMQASSIRNLFSAKIFATGSMAQTPPIPKYSSRNVSHVRPSTALLLPLIMLICSCTAHEGPAELMITSDGNILFYNAPNSIFAGKKHYFSYVTKSGKAIIKATGSIDDCQSFKITHRNYVEAP